MSKAVLISIRPKWCSKIANGEKTIEVRKRQPQLDVPFKVYIYCTQSADMLWILRERERSLCPDKIADVFKAAKCGGAYRGNGKVIGEFTCNRVTNLFSNSRFWLDEDDVLHTCLSAAEMRKYANGAHGLYGWHISDLRVYDHRAICGSLPACGRQNSALRPGQSPARRRAGGMWRKNYGTTD